MLILLEKVYSVAFWSGAFCGSVFWLAYCRAKARYLDLHRPLPDGQRHTVGRMSRQWLAGLCAALSLGYVLMATEKASNHTSLLESSVGTCWTETYQHTREQIRINAENDQISRQQQQLQRDYDRATSDWLEQLLAPPGDLANMDTNSPQRRAWGLAVTADYQNKINDLGARFDQLAAQRAQLDQQRAQHPLPEERCGK